MSFLIEYNRKVYKDFHNESLKYFLVIKQGSSNTYDYFTGLRERDWYIIRYGELKDILEEVENRAKDLDNGEIQKCIGWNEVDYWNVEQYKKLHLQAINNAKSMEKFFVDFDATARLYLCKNFGTAIEVLTERVKPIFLALPNVRSEINKYDEEIITAPIKDAELLHKIAQLQMEYFGVRVVLEFKRKFLDPNKYY